MYGMRLWAFGLLLVGVLATTVFCTADDDGRKGSLPRPRVKGTISLEAVLAARRSVRDYTAKPLDTSQIGQLCWAAQGVTEPDSGKRTAPSAGALYPLEVDIVTGDGVFRYDPSSHSLKQRLETDVRDRLSAAALNQRWVKTAPAVIVISGVVSRTQRKYGKRAQRYVYLEAGHAAQNVLLQAEALGLAAVPVGAFQDAEVVKVLDLGKGETPIYLIPAGRPKKADRDG
ncbi:MAG: SagB/ThcOx family dehydrogenase [Phycisphaerae bacterium]